MNNQSSTKPEAVVTELNLLSKRQTAQQLGISPRTLDGWMKLRKLPFLRLGKIVRFDANDVATHLRRNFRVAAITEHREQ